MSTTVVWAPLLAAAIGSALGFACSKERMDSLRYDANVLPGQFLPTWLLLLVSVAMLVVFGFGLRENPNNGVVPSVLLCFAIVSFLVAHSPKPSVAVQQTIYCLVFLQVGLLMYMLTQSNCCERRCTIPVLLGLLAFLMFLTVTLVSPRDRHDGPTQCNEVQVYV